VDYGFFGVDRTLTALSAVLFCSSFTADVCGFADESPFEVLAELVLLILMLFRFLV